MVQVELDEILLQFWISKGSSGNHGNKRRVKEEKWWTETERLSQYEAANRIQVIGSENEFKCMKRFEEMERQKYGGGGEGGGGEEEGPGFNGG